jgi:tetratricopeptide (TPR) repeat protein
MSDRAELEMLLAHARTRQRDDPAGTLPIFRHVADLAARAGETLLEADAWVGYGESVGSIDGRELESLDYFLRAATLAPGSNIEALACMSAGSILRFCGNADLAAKTYTRAVTLFAGLEDAFGECLARQGLADVLESQGRAEEAIPHLARASSLALDSDEPGMAADLQRRLSALLGGQREEAAPGLAENRAGTAPSGTPAQLLAGALVMAGQAQESIRWFLRAAEQFAADGDAAGLLQAETGRLQALTELQQWDEMDLSRKILAMTEGDRTPPARSSKLIALCYQVQALTAAEDWAGAGSTAIQAADVAAELDERELEARLRLGAGHSLRLVKRFGEAAGAYERALTVIGGMPDASGWRADALEGLGAVLRDSPETGARRLQPLAERYASAGDRRMEALCRYELAVCLHSIKRAGTARREEGAAHFARAAELFDQVGDVSRAGESWYRAADAYNWLGLLDPDCREKSYGASGLAADRFESAGNLRGKGLAELIAGQTLRQDDPAAPHDPRSLPALRASVRSFERAGWSVAETGSRILVTAELARAGTDDEWMASGRDTLGSYEAARAGLLVPQHRERFDKQIIRGLQILSSHLWQSRLRRAGTAQWKELAWRLEQAVKGRSFLDQHHQDEVWNSLVSSDSTLRELTGKIEHLGLRLDDLGRKIDAALVAGRLDDDTRALADQRESIDSDLEQAQRQLDLRVEEMVQERPDQAELASIRPVTRQELQACLSPGEAYLGYLWNGGSVIRSLVTPGTVNIQPADSEFHDYVRRAVAAARDGETPPDDGLAAVAGLLGEIPADTDTLIISPDGLLNGFPWHLAPLPGSGDPGQALADRYSTAIVPAGGFLARLRTGQDGGAPRRDAAYLGVACDGAAAGRRLASVDREVEAVARDYFAADPGSGFLATADCHQLLERGCCVDLLHLACHADRNGLLLSRDGTWVTPVDLMRPSLRAGILLLTGCRAGDFSGQDNNEFLGVVRQLMIATRSRAAIVSVAPVPDDAAPVFADLVVSALTGHDAGRPWRVPTRPLAAGPAVAWARQALRERSRSDVAALSPDVLGRIRPWDPRWWSPWFVIGDPRAALAPPAISNRLHERED